MGLEDKFEYHINQTNERLRNIEVKIDQLISFRVMLIGAAVGISGIVSIICNVLVFLMHN